MKTATSAVFGAPQPPPGMGFVDVLRRRIQQTGDREFSENEANIAQQGRYYNYGAILPRPQGCVQGCVAERLRRQFKALITSVAWVRFPPQSIFSFSTICFCFCFLKISFFSNPTRQTLKFYSARDHTRLRGRLATPARRMHTRGRRGTTSPR